MKPRRRPATLVIACLVTLGIAGFQPGGAGSCDDPGANPADCGNWVAPFAENPAYAANPPATVEESMELPPAVSIVVLPDGRILYWGGLTGLEDSAAPLALDAGRSGGPSPSRVLDLRDGVVNATWETPTPETAEVAGLEDHDMFCADQRLLADGRAVIVGGTIWRNDPIDLTPHVGEDGPGGTAELFGSNATRLYDATTDTFDRTDFMNYGRWYPSLVTMADGNLLVAGGVERLLYNMSGFNVHQTEIFDPTGGDNETGSWTLTGPDGDVTLPLFARLHLLPDGTIFYGGAGQMWSPFGQALDQALDYFHKAYDPAANSWTVTGMGTLGARSGALSILLPLRPDGTGAYSEDAEILVGGGVLGTSPGTYVAHNLTEIITVSDGESSSVLGPPLNTPRWYSSGVLLPDGSVVAVSGADKDEVLQPGSEFAVRQAELFDGDRWIPLASGARDRTYHNAAVLLADGSVLVAGHSPINAGYGPTGDNTYADLLGTANNMKDPSLEILEPPYLFRGTRPIIDEVQLGIDHGATVEVSTPDAGTIDQMVLVRLPSTTHITDADMRAVELQITDQDASDGTVTVVAPPNGSIAPPGFYYLFALRDNGDGLTPSKAHIVRVGAGTDLTPAEAPFGK